MADLDGDGDADLVVADRRSSSLLVFLQSAEGVFPEPVVLTGGDAGLFTVVTADLDGDGDADMAAAAITSVSIFLNLGKGQFAPPSVFQFGGSANSLASGDFDRDGDLDLAVGFLNAGKVTVIVNAGDGSFRTSADLGL